eukprot:2743206-Lingulodinium_polyedra.AAC.1
MNSAVACTSAQLRCKAWASAAVGPCRLAPALASASAMALPAQFCKVICPASTCCSVQCAGTFSQAT